MLVLDDEPVELESDNSVDSAVAVAGIVAAFDWEVTVEADVVEVSEVVVIVEPIPLD